MASTVSVKNFPSQVVSDIEKVSYDYGMKVAKAIEHEWYGDNQSTRRGSYSMQGHNQRNFRPPMCPRTRLRAVKFSAGL